MPAARLSNPFALHLPAVPRAPVVVASPHSGSEYPEDFLKAARLDPLSLRQSEDYLVDRLFGAAPRLGMPLLAALFPRAYVDPNREAWELDPAMFDGPLPDWVNTASPRVAAGLGTIARIVADGQEIYRAKLSFGEIRRRIEGCYESYHAALEVLVAETVERFGFCLLLDTHSMPSTNGARIQGGVERARERRPDIVLGDRLGTSCDAAVTALAEATLRGLGYRTVRNAPYAGGFTTQHYGRPARGRHCLQVEINRDLYMDERRMTATAGSVRLEADMRQLLAALARLDLRPIAAGAEGADGIADAAS